MNLSLLAFGSISFLGGVFFADIFREFWVFNLLFLFFLLPVFARNFWMITGEKSQKRIIFREHLSHLLSGIFGFLAGCIFLFFSLQAELTPLQNLAKNSENSENSENLEQNKSVKIQAIIISFPKYKSDKIQFEARTLPSSPEEKSEKFLVQSYQKIPDLEYGNKIEISGKIRLPEYRDGEKFHYDRFLEKSEIYAYFSSARIKILKKSPEEIGKQGIFWQKVFAFRSEFEGEIRKKLPVVESEYAIGILLGAEWGIPENILEEFNDTGLRHLLALSGFNITILILIFFQIFFFLPKFFQILFSLILITFFVFLTGGTASVVRAAIMGGLGLIILHSGRGNRENIPKLVLITLVCMTLWNPFVLVSDASLQFSILAVLGLYYFVPFLKEKFSSFSKKTPFFSDILFATLSAQLFTLPLSVVLFENFSLIAPLANIIVAPITSFAMLFSFFTALPYIGWFFVPFSYALLHFSLAVAHLFSLLSYSHIETSGLPMWTLFPFFLALFFLILKIKK